MARELDWLILQTSGKAYFTVTLNQTTHPVGEHSYAYPNGPAAEMFARNAVKTPGISWAKVLDPEGRVVLDFTEKDKYTVETIKTETGYAYQYKE